METRSPYPTDISDEEWAFVVPYLTVLPEDAAQRKYRVREVFNGVRYIVKSGAHWRLMPHDLPPWPLVYQQLRRWMDAGCFEAIVHDLRILLRRAAERPEPPTAAILDARTIQSTPESGARAGDDGHQRRKGSKGHVAVDTWGHLLALLVTPADEQERAQVEELASAVQQVTGEHVELAYVDQGYTGPEPAEAAAGHGIQLAVVKLPETKGASCSSPGAGSWSGVSLGPRASAGSRATMNGWRRPWPPCISWPSSVSCCIASPL